MSSSWFHFGLLLIASSSVAGCFEKSKATGSRAQEGATTAAQSSNSQAVKAPPSKEVGVVEGTVTVDGDPPLVIDADSQKIPPDCDVARVMYPPLFREGPGRTLADAFVGVTGYKGVAQEKTGNVEVEAKGCAFGARTYGLFSEQQLRVKSGDERSYIPSLFGTRSKSTLVALPHGSSVPVFHKGPGQYVLVNDMQIFTQATVLVVDYPTFDVTKLDGKFRIEGVPVGPSEISAFLPAVKLTTTEKIRVELGKVTQVNLKLHFDAAAFKAARSQHRSSPAGAPAAPTTPTQ